MFVANARIEDVCIAHQNPKFQQANVLLRCKDFLLILCFIVIYVAHLLCAVSQCIPFYAK